MLARCAWIHSVCDLEASQMNRKHGLIWELMLYKFEMSHDATEATKNIFYVKGEGVDDHSNQMIQEILLGLQKSQQSGKVRLA